MNSLYLDIESIPSQRLDVRNFFSEKVCADTKQKLSEVRAPSNYKDEAKIAEYINTATRNLLDGEDAAIDAELSKTGLDGSFGQVICICWAWDDGPIKSAYAVDLSLTEERRVIGDLFADVLANLGKRYCTVGHNVAAFDLRFLKQRGIVHGLSLPLGLPFEAKPWDETIFDTMLQWSGVGQRISMDKLCLALGIPGKGGISGADVWPMAQAGKFAEIAAYCCGDVERTRAIHKRMTFVETTHA